MSGGLEGCDTRFKKGVLWNVAIDGERMSMKNIELYKRALEAKRKKNAVFESPFKCINNQGFDISTKEQILMTCRIASVGSWTTMCLHWHLVIND